MDVSRPYTAVTPSLDGEVLHVLAGTSMAMTGRQIALLTGRISHSGVLDVLHRLTEQGLVDRVELNRSSLYSLNREHLAAPAVIELAELRLALLDRIRAEIGRWKSPPAHASVFGSTARGEGDAHSDIDLFLVRPAATGPDDDRWREQLDELARHISRWTGNHVAMHEVSKSELAQLRDEERPILGQLREDSIALAGADLTTLLDQV